MSKIRDASGVIIFLALFFGFPTLLLLVGLWMVSARSIFWRLLGVVFLLASAVVFYFVTPLAYGVWIRA